MMYMRAALVAALCFTVFHPAPSWAAAVNWVGSGDNATWGDGLNWFPSGQPGVADDVTIAATVVVTIGAAVSVNINSLNLGDGISSPTLKVQNSIANIGTLTMAAASTLEVDTTFVQNLGTVIVSSNAVLTHTGPVDSSTVAIRIAATNFNLQAGARVDLTGRGFNGGGPLADGKGIAPGLRGGAIIGAGGAGHGSLGGDGNNASGLTGIGGAASDSQSLPVQLGSGGGGALAPCFGGAGGGRFELITTTATLDGVIDVDGGPGLNGCSSGGGGGAGGTVQIQAQFLYGGATITARGGDGGAASSVGGGGGSGGRIALHLLGDVLADFTVKIDGGAGGAATGSGNVGASGTTYSNPKIWLGNAGGSCSDSRNWFSGLAPQANENILFGSSNTLTGCNWDVPILAASLGTFTMTSDYQGVINWTAAFSNIGGDFVISGGTLTSSNSPLRVAGNWTQTGGLVALDQGTVTFNGTGVQRISQLSGSYFRAVNITGTSGLVTQESDLLIRGDVTLGDRFRNATGGYKMRLRGDLLSSPQGPVGDTEWVMEGISPQVISTGPYNALTLQNAAGVSFSGSDNPVIGPGKLLLNAAAALDITNREVQLSGDFTDGGGAFTVTGSTISFMTSTTTVRVLASGTLFNHVHVRKPDGVVSWETGSIIGGDITLASTSTFSLANGSTLSVRGDWNQIENAVLSPGTGTVVFDGSNPQVVFATGTGPFFNFGSSNPAGVTLSTDILVTGDLVMQQGALDFSGRAIEVQGDFLQRGGTAPSVLGSTVTLTGTTTAQVLDLGPLSGVLDSLVIDNSSSGVILANNLAVGRNFTVNPGRIFDGQDKVLSMTGDRAIWNTAGALYQSLGGGAHVIQWNPTGGTETLFVTAGSTIDARIDAFKTTWLQGDLYLNGSGNIFNGQSGLTLVASNTAVYFQDSTDISFPSDGRYEHDANSWLVYRGTGANRGLFLSTGPFGNIRFDPESPSDTFAFNDIQMDGDIVLNEGILRNNGNNTLDLRGDLTNNGGKIQFNLSSTGTFRFSGNTDQTITLGPEDIFGRFETAGSSQVILASSRLHVAGDLVLSSGTLNAGAAIIDIEGDWSGVGGGFLAQTSTVVFSSTGTGAVSSLNDGFGTVFNGLSVQVATMAFQSTFTATVLTSTRPDTLLRFTPSGSDPAVIKDLRINPHSLTNRIRLRSSVPGIPFQISVVGVSTITAADLSDVLAVGNVIHANDGDTLDSGGNVNVNFSPQLLIIFPGEVFTDAVGKSNVPVTQTAGTPFSVTVRAISDRFRTRTDSTALVTLTTIDDFDTEPAPAALVAGVGSFTVSLRTAEPAPFPSSVGADSPSVFAGTSSLVNVQPGAYDRLQLVYDGQVLIPGSAAGRSGEASAQVAGQPIRATARATDSFWNLITSVSDTVGLTTATAISTATLPSPLAMTAGLAAFDGIIALSTSTLTLGVENLSNVGISSDTGGPIIIFALSVTSPTVTFGIPQNSVVPTLGSALVGTASDDVVVVDVRVAIAESPAGTYFDWTQQTFSSAIADFSNATLSPQNSPETDWSMAFPEPQLTSGQDYFVIMIASNPSQLQTVFRATFTYDTGTLVFNPTDGQGTASVAPSLTPGCRAITSTVTYGAGAGGVAPGGAVALRLPEGWTRPSVLTGGSPNIGEVRIALGTPASTNIRLNPTAFGENELGDGWVLVEVLPNSASPISAGETLSFFNTSFPQNGPTGQGEQVFDLRVQGDSAGKLVSIASVPVVSLSAGPPKALRFNDARPLALGPLQASSTMYLEATDACGNITTVAVSTTVGLSAGVPSSATFTADVLAQFISGGSPVGEVTIPAGKSRSAMFTFQTSTSGVAFEVLRATAAFTGQMSADRAVYLKTAAVALTNVSIDTGTLSPSATSALILPGGAASRAFIRFTLPDADLEWEVVVATDTTFYPGVFRAGGFGDPQRPILVPWEGLICGAEVCGYSAPGRYPVRIRVVGGAAKDTTLELRIDESGSIRGNLGAAGASAIVRAEGENAGRGSFAVASSTGYFQIHGLKTGSVYTLTASTENVGGGRSVTISTQVFNVSASSDVGTRSFPSPSFIRVNVGIPFSAPIELFGKVSVHDAGFENEAFGTIHFSSGRSRSDDGATALSLTASTWTILPVRPGTYDLEVDLARIGISTRILSLTVTDGGVVDVPIQLTRQSNVYGWVVVPSTQPFGTPISVQAVRQGSRLPAAYASGFVPVSTMGVVLTSAPYSLFGLTEGTWTFTAQGEGFISVSSTRFVARGTDIGDPDFAIGDLDFSLSLGSVLAGSITVTGDTSGLSDLAQVDDPALQPGFSIRIHAYDPATFQSRSTRVRVSTSNTVASATYTISGLVSGTTQLVSAFLEGFEKNPPGASTVVLSTTGITDFNVAFRRNSSQVRLDIDIPPLSGGACHPPADFRSIGLFFEGPDIRPQVYSDITLYDDSTPGAFETVFCSSISVTVPGLGEGDYRFQLAHGPSGNAQEVFLPLSNGTTHVAHVDLAASTYTVSGAVALSGVVRFPVDGLSVSVSSISGLVAHSTSTAYCLLTSSEPVIVSAARVELIPMGVRSTLVPGALRPSTGTCLTYEVAPSSAAAPSLMAHIGEIQAGGSYTISGVPAGSYLLRTIQDLDGDAASGNEVARVSRIIAVGGNTTEDIVIENGARISGVVTLPVATVESRPVVLTLSDSQGNVIRRKILHFNKTRIIDYVFENIADGRYTLSVVDLGKPAAFAAVPTTVVVEGGDRAGQDMRFQAAGRIRGRIAVERIVSSSTREYVLITRENKNLLPGGLKIAAVATPWFQGGHFTARGEQCAAGGCERVALDTEGAFEIQGVLPGVYDVEFNVLNSAANGRDGRLDLVSGRQAGVRVDARQTHDMGVVRLRAGATLNGSVTDAASGVGLAHISITARPSVHAPGSSGVRVMPPTVQTGRNGVYQLRGLDPDTRFYDIIAAERPEGVGAAQTASHERTVLRGIDLQSTTTLNFSLAPANFAVTGRAVSSKGGSVSLSFDDGGVLRPGARLYLKKEGDLATLNPLGNLVARTEPDGTFTIPHITPGSYRITATAQEHASASAAFTIVSSTADVGTLTLAAGGVLSGTILTPTGDAPGEDEIEFIFGAASDRSEILIGDLEMDPIARAVTGYRISGFRSGVTYRVVLVTPNKDLLIPEEGRFVVFQSSIEARELDLVFKREAPFVLAKSRKNGNNFLLDFRVSQPLRARTTNDEDVSLILSTVAAQGSLSSVTLSKDRTQLTADYAPGVGESSFTVRFKAFSALKDPNSTDTVNGEFLVQSTFSFFAGLDGYHRTSIPNLTGGSLAIEGDAGRVTVPEGAFFVDPSSAIVVIFQRSNELLTDAERFAASGMNPAAANIQAMRHAADAYPPGILSAIAATPPTVNPLSAFYDVLLPLGVRTALAEPVPLTLSYAEGSDPTALNVYWFNPAANAYVLQQDVTGAAPDIDTINRTITINVNHFSTFVLFQTGVAVISGSGFTGSEIEAYNFPNPFDLSVKTVTPIHGVGAQSIRGTMIRFSVPAETNSGGRIHIFNVAGQRVRTIDLGTLSGGQHYYQPWDGRNDSGRDVASGVYFGQVKVGNKMKFFKMAVLQ